MANFVSYSNATELMQAIADKFNELPAGIIPRGSLTFSNLPTTLTASMLGYAYNVSDDFTTTALFVEGAGKDYSAGTNVVVVNVGDETTPDYKYDVYGNFIDTDPIYEEIDNVSDMIAGEFDTTESYSTGDVVVYNSTLYKFKADHAAGAWDASEADETTVSALISAAEPDSLTSDQISALVALLD